MLYYLASSSSPRTLRLTNEANTLWAWLKQKEILWRNSRIECYVLEEIQLSKIYKCPENYKRFKILSLLTKRVPGSTLGEDRELKRDVFKISGKWVSYGWPIHLLLLAEAEQIQLLINLFSSTWRV